MPKPTPDIPGPPRIPADRRLLIYVLSTAKSDGSDRQLTFTGLQGAINWVKEASHFDLVYAVLYIDGARHTDVTETVRTRPYIRPRTH